MTICKECRPIEKNDCIQYIGKNCTECGLLDQEWYLVSDFLLAVDCLTSKCIEPVNVTIALNDASSGSPCCFKFEGLSNVTNCPGSGSIVTILSGDYQVTIQSNSISIPSGTKKVIVTDEVGNILYSEDASITFSITIDQTVASMQVVNL